MPYLFACLFFSIILFYSFLCYAREQDMARGGGSGIDFKLLLPTSAQQLKERVNFNECAHKNLHLLLCMIRKPLFFPLHICLCLKFVCLFTICRDQCDQTGPWTAGGTSAEEGHARCGRHEAAGRRSSWTLPAPSIFQNPRQCTPEK